MIAITDIYGRKRYLAASAIAQIKEAGASQAWHGIRSNVQTTTGEWIEAQESPEQIVRRMDDERLIAAALDGGDEP